MELKTIQKSRQLISSISNIPRGKRSRIPYIRESILVWIQSSDLLTPVSGKLFLFFRCFWIQRRSCRDPKQTVEVSRTTSLPLKTLPVVRET
jgi:hypothetical protein